MSHDSPVVCDQGGDTYCVLGGAVRILCGGPVSEDADVFKAHIESLLSQGYAMDYKGIDNSPAPLDAPVGFDNVMWRREPSLGEYKENRVRWSRALLRKMKAWREEMRLAAVAGAYDYLFMVDSDLILGSDTLRLLIAENKDFISGVVWTRWRPWRNWVTGLGLFSIESVIMVFAIYLGFISYQRLVDQK